MPNLPLSRSWPEIRQALEHARECEDGPVNAQSAAVLEAAITELWNRIQAQPESYVLTPDEFALFNYFLATRYRGSTVAQRAVARFWNSYQKTTNCDGVSN
ncbi:hypothetical protein E8E15_001716 [Penicillium rubens]|jgi:hypothetical protein|uniref:Pc16g01810 protein n=2 Tax=Penicillium chrysogenum species complex TaxID=254878 RepID=B6H759_PENRW|nr:uncharacterized protein N7525_011500 [Penicillium rubens]KZN83487.1 hypothetical protein EN45_105860 [Penicillium chrysogenum]CAP92851.1 Pc16g01810 [Penicillium rubens Wisconsin 54-1255]KAF3015683.1 hypothetical protein E8E15_001716 [Penicillium rubens]KAJ5037124.1 hypothetical protein NUH16_005007 [Penicillium rubens]KAJ5822216.1 hypothetical protein N7525_011500 [Penicillium rubens]